METRSDDLSSSPPEASPALGAGTVLAARYELVRFIASGGMGAVYEAQDLVLGRRVALKTLPPERSADERALAYFRREIDLAQRVTHPNICRSYDVREEKGLTFLTMELVTGETLAERLRRDGRLGPRAALPLVQQMAAGLDAAHAAGVVHRDFKSRNVMLAGGRVVVTDFGLARIASDAPGTEPVTLSDGATGLVGTPAYMSPEQVTGAPVGPAADIYALGVVLFEMVTGQLPFTGANPLAIATRRLEAPPPSPRQLARGLDRRWQQVILRCLARRPEDRFKSAGDVARALVAPPRWRWPALTIVAVLALGATALGVWPRAATHAPVTVARPVVALAPLTPGQGAEAWMGRAIATAIEAELATGEQIVVVAEPRGATHQVTGRFTLDGAGRVELALTLLDAGGAALLETRVAGHKMNLQQVGTSAAEVVRQRLGLPRPVTEKPAVPGDPELARLLAEGEDLAASAESAKALVVLEKAARLAPSDPMVWSAYSRVLLEMARYDDAEDAAERAVKLAAGLPREQRLLLEGRLASVRGDLAASIATYETLHDLFPEKLEYADYLLGLHFKRGDWPETIVLFEEVTTHPSLRDALGLEPMRAGILAHKGDLGSALAVSDAATVRAVTLGLRGYAGQMRSTAAVLAYRIGDLPAAARRLEVARGDYQATNGHDLPRAHVFDLAVELAQQRGDAAGARAVCERQIRYGQEAGKPHLEMLGWRGLTTTLRLGGDLAGAEDALAHDLELTQRQCTGSSCLWPIVTERAKLALARKRWNEAETLARSLLTDLPDDSTALRLLSLAQCGRREGRDAHEAAVLALRAAESMYDRLAARQALACALEQEGDRPAGARLGSEVAAEARRLGFQTLSL